MSESTDDEPEITAMVLEARRWESDKRWYQALLRRRESLRPRPRPDAI